MRIAVIGAGIAGLGAAWLLHPRHEVVVYEQEARPGGHANTVTVPGRRPGETIPVDTGFIVYNEVTYPNLVRLFDRLGVPTRPSDMSFAVSIGGGRLEYAAPGPRALFAQKRNLLRPEHYRMLRDLLRFYREAPSLLATPEETGPTLGDYLAAGGYGSSFTDHHLLPMGAAIWSSSCAGMLEVPAHSFIRFFHNHGLLLLRNRPQWRTVAGGSRDYVERLSTLLTARLRAGRPVVAVRRLPQGVLVRDGGGHEDRFDQVVLACHADQALALIAGPTPEERRVLSAFRYQANRAVLHGDPALMPRRRAAWASWTCLSDGRHGAAAAVSVTYWMNRLQGLDPAVPLFVSLNPLRPPHAALTLAAFVYHHPLFDRAAIAAQRALGQIQGLDRLWFCGSYCGYGFHEDGLSAGLAVAEALGARRPWAVTESSPAGRNATPQGSRLPAPAG